MRWGCELHGEHRTDLTGRLLRFCGGQTCRDKPNWLKSRQTTRLRRAGAPGGGAGRHGREDDRRIYYRDGRTSRIPARLGISLMGERGKFAARSAVQRVKKAVVGKLPSALVERIAAARRVPAPKPKKSEPAHNPKEFGPAALLSRDPPIFVTGMALSRCSALRPPLAEAIAIDRRHSWSIRAGPSTTLTAPLKSSKLRWRIRRIMLSMSSCSSATPRPKRSVSPVAA